jgi:hypothetical protein
MSLKSSSSSPVVNNTYDQRIALEDGGTVFKDVGDIHIESIDGDLIARALGITGDNVNRALASVDYATSDALAGMRGVAGQGLDLAGETISAAGGVIDAINSTSLATQKETNDLIRDIMGSNQTLASAIGATAANTMTTLRDTLSATLGSDNLAGSAEQSGGLSGWLARNPALAAIFGLGVLGLGAMVILKKPGGKSRAKR